MLEQVLVVGFVVLVAIFGTCAGVQIVEMISEWRHRHRG